jgi:hypothetical protein
VRLFEFYQQLRGLSRPDSGDVAGAGESGARHADYHKRVFLVGCVFGVLGLIFGLMLPTRLIAQAELYMSLRAIPLTLSCGAYGFLFGMAVMCLFAPKEFLAGPVGRKWLNVVGTQKIRTTRIVCLISILAIAAFPVLICLLALGF